MILVARRKLSLCGVLCALWLWAELLCVPMVRAQSADVPLQHSVYFLLERLATLLPQRSLDLHVVPVKRAQVLAVLQEA